MAIAIPEKNVLENQASWVRDGRNHAFSIVMGSTNKQAPGRFESDEGYRTHRVQVGLGDCRTVANAHDLILVIGPCLLESWGGYIHISCEIREERGKSRSTAGLR